MAPFLGALAPTVSWRGVEATAHELRTRFDISGIVTFSDAAIPATAALADDLELVNHSSAASRLLIDKYEQRRALAQGNIERMRAVKITNLHGIQSVERSIFPAVLKPVSGTGSSSVYRVRDIAEVQYLWQHELPKEVRAQGVLLEEELIGRNYAPYGDYVSVESIVQAGRVEHVAVTGKYKLVPPFRETGQFWPSALSSDEDELVRSLSGRAIGTLGLSNGLTHTEIKLTESGPRIIEINGRLGGFVYQLYRQAFDIDLVRIAGEIALQLKAPFQSKETAGGVFFQFSNLPPADMAQLIRIRGGAEVRRRSHITSYSPLLRLPSRLVPGVSTQELDLLQGHVRRREQMFREIRSAASKLQFDFVTRDGSSQTMRGCDLPSHLSL